MKKCVGYLRVSTEKQAEEGFGLDSQKRDVIKYAETNDFQITKWYVDDGYSGANMDRPALTELLSEVYAHNISNIIVFKLDRLSRDMVDNLYIIEKILIPNNVELHSVHDVVNYDTPMSQAYTQMMAVFAQLDKNTMRLRMKGGMLERVKKGYWMGGGVTPYCYRYDSNLGYLVPIPEKAKRANEALDLFIDGMSDKKISNILGFGNEFLVRKILTSVTNIGYIPYKGKVYKGLHEPVFDLKKFEAAQELRTIRRKNRSYSRPDVNILTGLCYCGVCGCSMRYQKWSKKGKKIYCCSNDEGLNYLPNWNPNCDNIKEWASVIEKGVEDEIKKISLTPTKTLDISNKSEKLEKEIDNIKQGITRLYNLYASGNDDVLELIEQKKKQIDDINNELEHIKELEQNKTKRQNTIKQIKKLGDMWDNINSEEKNKILKTIVERIIVHKDTIEIELRNV